MVYITKHFYLRTLFGKQRFKVVQSIQARDTFNVIVALKRCKEDYFEMVLEETGKSSGKRQNERRPSRRAEVVSPGLIKWEAAQRCCIPGANK